MDCGIPFCHNGCPVNNLIPDWNNLVYRDQWRDGAGDAALDQQFSGVHRPHLPRAVRGGLHAEHRRQSGHDQNHRMRDRRPRLGGGLDRAACRRRSRPARRVAVVGSGPAGLACAQQLARAGHGVTVFEKNDRIGGLLRYGIPDFKMEKHLIDRRIEQMAAEGVEFRTGVEVGVRCRDGDAARRVRRGGDDRRRRDGRAISKSPGRELAGIHFAMDFLTQQNKRVAGDAEDARRARRHDQRQGQARRRDRRRRYRLGLHRHLEPPGRGLDHAARDPAEAAGARKQGADLARLAAEAAHLVVAGRRLRARLVGADQARASATNGKIDGARMRARRMGARAPTAAGDGGDARQRVSS